MSVESPQLVVLESATHALALANTIGEIKMIRDKAEAVRKYAQSAALGLDAQNRAAEVKLRAERKAGQLLSSLNLRGGDRKSNNHADCLKLDDLGISQNQSTRWQREAQLSEDVFEEYLRTKQAAGGEILAAGVLRLAKIQSKQQGETASQNVKAQTAGDDLEGNSPQPKTQRKSAGPQPPLRDELMGELKDHCNLLDDILRPIYSGTSEKLRSGERRGLGHLMTEIRVLLKQLSQ